MSVERQLAALRAAAACLGEGGIEFILIGGLAVHLHVAGAGDANDAREPGSPPKPEELARSVRVTRDVDLVVAKAALQDAVHALQEVGFEDVPMSDSSVTRLTGHGSRVDLLCPAGTRPTSPRNADLETTLACLDIETHLGSGLYAKVPIADAASLVVLKAAAWGDRHEEGDLVDVARIALIDRDFRRVSRRLEEIGPMLPDVLVRRMREMAECFSSPDASGAGAFARSLMTELRFDDTLEDEVRAVVATVARRLIMTAL